MNACPNHGRRDICRLEDSINVGSNIQPIWAIHPSLCHLRPNAGALSSHQDCELRARHPTHGERNLSRQRSGTSAMCCATRVATSWPMGGTPGRSNTTLVTGRLLRRFATGRSRRIGLRISGADPRLAPASGELPSRPRYSGRIRVGHHGDQARHRSDRPDQANRDHDGDSHHP